MSRKKRRPKKSKKQYNYYDDNVIPIQEFQKQRSKKKSSPERTEEIAMEIFGGTYWRAGK